MTPSLIVAALAIVIGAVVLRLGVRGRRVDDHPICRKCGFDLIGRPEGSEVCPECGADLRRPRAIRDGHRQWRRGLVAGGGVLLGLGLMFVGAGVVARVSGANLQEYNPTFWLLREVRSHDLPVAVDAARELSKRVTAGKMSQADVDAAADSILARGKNPGAKWDPALGDFIEDARLAKKLSDERYISYALGAATQAYGLEVRPTVNAGGDPLPFWIRQTPPWVGSRPTLQVEYSAKFELDDFELKTDYSLSDDRVLSPMRGGGATGGQLDLKAHADRMTLGQHELHAVSTVSVKPANAPPGTPPIAWTKVKLTKPFEIVPAEPSTVKVVADESIRREMEAGVSVQNLEYARFGANDLDFHARVTDVPVGIGYQVFIVTSDGKRHSAGTFTSAPVGKNSMSSTMMRATVPGLSAGAVDVVFVPNVDAAKRTTNVFEIWDGQITKRNQPVKYATPATTPATAATTTTQTAR
jgi:hypothetical protein